MSVNNPIKDMINAIGAMAEVSAMMYRELVKNGVPADHACSMVNSYIRTTLKADGGNNDGE